MDKLPEHLGGHMNKVHVDGGVLHYMQRVFGVETMIDIGCGPGESSNFSKSIRVIMLSVLMVIGLYFLKQKTSIYMILQLVHGYLQFQSNLIWLGLLNF
jgi:hypothetical protein